MPLRPPPPIALRIPTTTPRPWLPQPRIPIVTDAGRHTRTESPPKRSSRLHTSARLRSDDPTPNHYEVLQLSPSATPQEIKRQFFTLSKLHHPDKNPDDGGASARFVKISEAYHVLSVPDKRAQYDAQLHSSRSSSSSRGGFGRAHPHGSYSSASYAGSRPATGLNKKRGTFRGPPPSFYKSGGYGAHGAKRAEYAHHNPAAGKAGSAEGEEDTGSSGHYGGFGPGQTSHGSEVPHFNDARHKKMHDDVNKHIHARRRARASQHIVDDALRDPGMFINFLIVGGALGVIISLVVWFSWRNESAQERRKRKERQEPP